MATAAYLFLDEAGDLSFKDSGSRFFSMASAYVRRPFLLEGKLSSLRFNLIERGDAMQHFHATEDKQDVRDAVFNLIQQSLDAFAVDCIIAEKRKAHPKVRDDLRFYPEILGYLLRYVVRRLLASQPPELLVIITDTLPINKRRRAIEKAVKITLAKMLPSSIPFCIHHHDSRSCEMLQVVDYFNWAIFRKWERGDLRSYDLIKRAVASEFEVYRRGTTFYY